MATAPAWRGAGPAREAPIHFSGGEYRRRQAHRAPIRRHPHAGKPYRAGPIADGRLSRAGGPLEPRTAHRHGTGPAGHRGGGGGGRAELGQLTGRRLNHPSAMGEMTGSRAEGVVATVDEELRKMDDVLMSEAARCNALEDELKLLREDMFLERAANNDLRAELRSLRSHHASLMQERSENYGTISTLGGAKEFLQEDHQQLLHDVGVLRASESRLQREVRRLQDENAELRSYWEDGFAELQQQRTRSVTPQMLADRAWQPFPAPDPLPAVPLTNPPCCACGTDAGKHAMEQARSKRREKMLQGETEFLTDMLAESQRGHFSQLGRLVTEKQALSGAYAQAEEQRQRYLSLLEGTTGPKTSYDFVDLQATAAGPNPPAAPSPSGGESWDFTPVAYPPYAWQ
jgi:hypothetical protein